MTHPWSSGPQIIPPLREWPHLGTPDSSGTPPAQDRGGWRRMVAPQTPLSALTMMATPDQAGPERKNIAEVGGESLQRMALM